MNALGNLLDNLLFMIEQENHYIMYYNKHFQIMEKKEKKKKVKNCEKYFFDNKKLF